MASNINMSITRNYSNTTSSITQDGNEDLETPRTPFDYASFVCTLIMLFFCIVGIIGNILSVLIFTRPKMRSSINVLLAGLSLIDALMLSTSIIVFVVPNFQAYFRFSSSISSAYLETIVFGPYQLGMVAQTCSVWIFVLITIERYLAVCYPLKVSQIMSAKKARVALVFAIVLAVAYNCVRVFEYRKNRSEDGSGDGYSRYLRADTLYIYFYYISLYLLTHFFVPFFLITTLNVLIWLAIKKSHRLRSNMSRYSRQDSVGSQQSKKGAEKSMKTTQMIFVVTILFAICNTLPFALNVLEAVMPNIFDHSDLGLQSLAYLLVDISNTLVTFNSATTFLFYAAYCRKYRLLLCWYGLAPARLLFKNGNGSRAGNRFQTLLKRQSTMSVETTNF